MQPERHAEVPAVAVRSHGVVVAVAGREARHGAGPSSADMALTLPGALVSSAPATRRRRARAAREHAAPLHPARPSGYGASWNGG